MTVRALPALSLGRLAAGIVDGRRGVAWRHEITRDPARVRITAWGSAGVEGLLAIVSDAMKIPGWRPDLAALLDFRGLDIGTLRQGDILRLADEYRPFTGLIGAAPIAVLVSRQLDYGLVRMWEALVEGMNLPHGVFYEEGEAEAWLRGG